MFAGNSFNKGETNILMPKVSVIIPNYNHAPFLGQRIDSVLNQTFHDFELILLDDCSKDDSRNILLQYSTHPKVSHCVLNEENSGSPFKQWKKGIDLAKGDWIWVAESDDHCEPFFLQRVFAFIEQSKLDVGLVYAQSMDVDQDNKFIQDRIEYTSVFKPNIWTNNFEISGIDFVKKYLKVYAVIPNASAVVFRRSLVNEDFIDNEVLSMKIAGDWLFWIKLSLTTNVGFVSERLNYFRNHSAVTRNHNTYNKIMTRVMEEKKIRYILKERLEVDQSEEWLRIYRFWFKANNLFALFGLKLYKPRSEDTSLVDYIFLFASVWVAKKYELGCYYLHRGVSYVRRRFLS